MSLNPRATVVYSFGWRSPAELFGFQKKARVNHGLHEFFDMLGQRQAFMEGRERIVAAHVEN